MRSKSRVALSHVTTSMLRRPVATPAGPLPSKSAALSATPSAGTDSTRPKPPLGSRQMPSAPQTRLSGQALVAGAWRLHVKRHDSGARDAPSPEELTAMVNVAVERHGLVARGDAPFEERLAVFAFGGLHDAVAAGVRLDGRQRGATASDEGGEAGDGGDAERAAQRAGRRTENEREEKKDKRSL